MLFISGFYLYMDGMYYTIFVLLAISNDNLDIASKFLSKFIDSFLDEVLKIRRIIGFAIILNYSNNKLPHFQTRLSLVVQKDFLFLMTSLFDFFSNYSIHSHPQIDRQLFSFAFFLVDYFEHFPTVLTFLLFFYCNHF